MYQPYPTGAQMPDIERPPVPSQVANAVKVMYVGAATSILGIIIDILTVNATKSAIERHSRHLTASQVNASEHTLIAGFIVGGLIGAAAWIIVARNCQGGKNWARITGTVFFAIATIDTIVGVTVPLAGPVKIWGVVVWLVGLAAVVLLWQRPSTEFFTAPRPS
jgi:hypothetical protein